MNRCPSAAASVLLMAICAVGSTAVFAEGTELAALPDSRDGVRDFDFQVGRWHVQHRVKRAADGQWVQFSGSCSNSPVLGGSANIEDNTFNMPSGVTRGLALRAYDARSREWAIWWLDGRNPFGALDPPVKGRFIDGVGTFYSDGVVDGKSVRTRFIWSDITANSARWQQAYSYDAGVTWDTNWVMVFQRVIDAHAPSTPHSLD